VEAGNLTPKQHRFVEEYLVDLNATQAAVRAGYSERTAYSQGQRMLKDVEVAAAVQAAMDSRAQRTEITADYVLSNIAEVVERTMQRAPVMVGRGEDRTQLTDDEGRHVWEFNANGANKALELLGKHLKLFTDKVEHSGGVTVQIVRLGE
jgi:phage terminase small subunit